MALFEAALLKELEDVRLGQVTLASAIDSLEHLHRAKLCKQPLFIVKAELQEFTLGLAQLLLVLNQR